MLADLVTLLPIEMANHKNWKGILCVCSPSQLVMFANQDRGHTLYMPCGIQYTTPGPKLSHVTETAVLVASIPVDLVE